MRANLGRGRLEISDGVTHIWGRTNRTQRCRGPKQEKPELALAIQRVRQRPRKSKYIKSLGA